MLKGSAAVDASLYWDGCINMPTVQYIKSQFRNLNAADWRLIALLFFASRLIVVLAALVRLAAGPYAVRSDFFLSFCAWDCEYYSQIAAKGYDSLESNWIGGDEPNWAFFPLLPLIIAGFSQIFRLSVNISAFIVPHLLFFCTLVLLFLYLRAEWGTAISKYGVAVMAFFPLSVHASVAMSECVYLPLSIAAYYAARQKKWIAAGLCAALLSATRSLGVLVFVPLLMIALEQRRLVDLLMFKPGTERIILALASSGTGLAAFMIYLHARTGDVLAFSHVQVGWFRRFKWPWMTIFDDLNPVIVDFSWILYNIFNLTAAAVGLWACISLWRRNHRPEAAFLGLTVAIALCAGASTSLPRFVAATFPTVLAIVLASAQWRFKRWLLVVFALALFGASYAWVMEDMYVM